MLETIMAVASLIKCNKEKICICCLGYLMTTRCFNTWKIDFRLNWKKQFRSNNNVFSSLTKPKHFVMLKIRVAIKLPFNIFSPYIKTLYKMHLNLHSIKSKVCQIWFMYKVCNHLDICWIVDIIIIDIISIKLWIHIHDVWHKNLSKNKKKRIFSIFF